MTYRLLFGFASSLFLAGGCSACHRYLLGFALRFEGSGITSQEYAMVTRLVDVLNVNKTVVHTFPITLDDGPDAPDDTAYRAKALEAAANARLLPDVDLDSLTARIHVSRGGQMEPYGDNLDSSSETKAGLEQEVRERAYLLWESDGCPQGKEEEFWNRALEQHRRERAYVLWQQQGSTEGHAEDNWHQIRKFQDR